ncbi:D-2-hydroxyacid dehydrogenase [Evansella tamaricis]|uniref:D-2-hydroxyacid dehydrogenase n=1 Tax=Evansella tamaricis TaxID=2069301 RepID=A0ABS6JFX2_9BACI|nr:D-2-hydroxyacid dehydrogenase [Evansella tamaricis]MBU9712591.1 D-2-hydroxyacid dehydrogenase [Evansella tamaricis]
MRINNILMVSPMYKELNWLLEKRKDNLINKRFRFLPEGNVQEEDYGWADAFVSFKRPNNFQFCNIRWVHSLGAGVDKILKGDNWKEDVLLTRTICSFGQKISEYCLSYILRDLQQHNSYNTAQNKKEWTSFAPVPLKEKTVLVYGTGVIGQEVARTLSFFGVRVYGISLSGKQKDFFEYVHPSLDEGKELDKVKFPDYVINTMPNTKQTVGMFNKARFSKLEDAVFINVGRGESVDHGALLEALGKGIRLAVLDVFPEEPLPKDNPLWNHPNVIITPHISAITTPEEGIDCFLKTLHNIETGKALQNQVDLIKGF